MKKFAILFLALIMIMIPACGIDTPSNNSSNDFSNESNTDIPNSEDITSPNESANPETDFEYLTVDNEVTISGYIGQTKTVIIPEQISNKTVTRIGEEAFRSKEITSIKMPDSIRFIDRMAFQNCISLETVVLSNALSEIGLRAFENCTKLEQITLPSTLNTLGEEAFHQSGLKRLDIQAGLETIPAYAFAATQLTQVVLPESIKTIEFQAFAGCSLLTSVTLNEGLISIEHKAFATDTKINEIKIPKTVHNITDMAFSGCSNLKKVVFLGDAPETYKYSDPISGVWAPFDSNYTIYFYQGAKGFTTPTWYDYPSEIIQ